MADAANVNPQAKNIQNILAHWPDEGPSAQALFFGEPAPDVSSRSNVLLTRIRADRLWPLRVAVHMQSNWAGIVAPGLHMSADWFGAALRRATGRSIGIITTIEGLAGPAPDPTIAEDRYARAAGHEVFCQPVAPGALARRRSLHEQATHIVAISPFLRRMAELDFPGKVSMLPLGLDDRLFHANGRRENRCKPRVICVAGVRAHKRPEFFLDLAARYSGADFVWYGEGHLRLALNAEAARRSLKNLSFPGGLSPAALADAYRQADIFVLPSRSEGVPKVTQEAAACGLAQLIFGYYEAPTVVDGENGCVVWSDADMVAQLGKLIENPALRRRMGAAGVAMAHEWSWGRVAPLWRQRILDAICGTMNRVPTESKNSAA